DLEPETAGGLTYRGRAAHRATGTVERNEESVPGIVDLTALEPLQLLPDRGVIVRQQGAPGSIAQATRVTARIDHVSEEDRDEYAARIVREFVGHVDRPIPRTTRQDELRRGGLGGELLPRVEDLAVRDGDSSTTVDDLCSRGELAVSWYHRSKEMDLQVERTKGCARGDRRESGQAHRRVRQPRDRPAVGHAASVREPR